MIAPPPEVQAVMAATGMGAVQAHRALRQHEEHERRECARHRRNLDAFLAWRARR